MRGRTDRKGKKKTDVPRGKESGRKGGTKKKNIRFHGGRVDRLRR